MPVRPTKGEIYGLMKPETYLEKRRRERLLAIQKRSYRRGLSKRERFLLRRIKKPAELEMRLVGGSAGGGFRSPALEKIYQRQVTERATPKELRVVRKYLGKDRKYSSKRPEGAYSESKGGVVTYARKTKYGWTVYRYKRGGEEERQRTFKQVADILKREKTRKMKHNIYNPPATDEHLDIEDYAAERGYWDDYEKALDEAQTQEDFRELRKEFGISPFGKLPRRPKKFRRANPEVPLPEDTEDRLSAPGEGGTRSLQAYYYGLAPSYGIYDAKEKERFAKEHVKSNLAELRQTKTNIRRWVSTVKAALTSGNAYHISEASRASPEIPGEVGSVAELRVAREYLGQADIAGQRLRQVRKKEAGKRELSEISSAVANVDELSKEW